MRDVQPEFVPDKILGVIGEVVLSDTQKIRVLKVEEALSKDTRVSVQKWWRRDTNQEWSIGKGFKLQPSEAKQLGEILSNL